jgi:DNA repair exonuclease SbcCD ATPase subunit
MSEKGRAIEKQIKELEERLAEARARIPKHDVPPGLMVEIDEMDEELERLQALLKQKPVKEQIAELEERLQDARARIPKHTPPTGLMAEIDEIEEELERLRSLPEA